MGYVLFWALFGGIITMAIASSLNNDFDSHWLTIGNLRNQFMNTIELNCGMTGNAVFHNGSWFAIQCRDHVAFPSCQ